MGQVRDRATLTRVAGGALVAGPVGAVVGALLRKRVDERQAWLVVTGDQYDWVVEVRPTQLGQAREFAAAINAAARAAQEEQPGLVETAQPYRRAVGVYRPGLR